jgi:hypothetical protein
MYQRLAFLSLLLIVCNGCGSDSSPSVAPAPTPVSSPSPAPSPSPIVCVVTLSVGATIDGYPNGGSFPVSVTTTPPSGCIWTAATQASWIHIPNNATGGGSGTFTFTVDPNPGPVRAATLTVAGKIVAFNQTSSTSSCVYKLSVGTTIDGYPNGGTFRVTVTTKPSSRCSWTAASNADWLHITSGASGDGDATFTFVADANSGPARVGTLTAAGEIVVFNQTSTGAP